MKKNKLGPLFDEPVQLVPAPRITEAYLESVRETRELRHAQAVDLLARARAAGDAEAVYILEKFINNPHLFE